MVSVIMKLGEIQTECKILNQEAEQIIGNFKVPNLLYSWSGDGFTIALYSKLVAWNTIWNKQTLSLYN